MIFSEFYADGVEQASGHYVQNKLNGVLKNNYPNGLTQSLTFYEKDQKNGYFTTFTVDGVLFSQSNYLNSQLLNPVRTFHTNGDVSDSYYQNGRLIKTAILHENGETERFVYMQDQFNGFAQLFYSSGKLKRSIKIINGLKEGFGTRYYPTGQLQGLYHYKEGKLNGRSIRYNEDGHLQFILDFYKNHLESGSCRNGEPISRHFLDMIQKDPFAPYPEVCLDGLY